MDEETPSETAGQDGLARKAMEASMGLFRTPARQYAEQRINSGAELKDYMRRKLSAESAESHYITAESQCEGLGVGSVVTVRSSFLERVGSLSQQTLGEFIITEITHEVSEGNYYRNRFKAIPSALEAIPVPPVRFPNAETQMATVTRNDDPKGSGRIQVQMNWQSDGMHTDWIRVMTPDAGSSGDVKSNRGFVFIPEVGDQVLVGFRHGDPSRPYSLGSLFNGSTGKGGFAANHKKSLTTRSGSTVTFDDTAHTILLQTTRANKIFIDERNGTITISSAEEVNMNVNVGKNFTMQVGEDSNVAIGGDSSMNIQGNLNSIVSKDVTSHVEGDTTHYVKGALNVTSEEDTSIHSFAEIKMESEDETNIASKKNMYIKSGVKVDIAKK